MGTISRGTTWVTGQTLTASALNGEFNILFNEVNGNLDQDNFGTITGTMTFANSGNTKVLDITSSATTTTPVTITANSLTTGSALDVLSNSADTGTRNLVQIRNTNSLATGTTLVELEQDANQVSVNFTTAQTTANVVNLVADSLTTGTAVDISGDALTTGNLLKITSDSADTSSRRLVQIINDNSAANSTSTLFVQQDADHHGIEIDANGGGNAITANLNTNGKALQVNATGATTQTQVVDIVGDNLTSGNLVMIRSNSSDATGRTLFHIRNDHVSATGTKIAEFEQDADAPYINYTGATGANTTSPLSTHTTSGATTHHIQIQINDVKAWIAASTNNPS